MNNKFRIFKRVKLLEQQVKKLTHDLTADKQPAIKVINIASGLPLFRMQCNSATKYRASDLSKQVNEAHFELPEGYIIKEILLEKKT